MSATQKTPEKAPEKTPEKAPEKNPHHRPGESDSVTDALKMCLKAIKHQKQAFALGSTALSIMAAHLEQFKMFVDDMQDPSDSDE